MSLDKKDDENLICSFCGKDQADVGMLIAGRNIYICSECVGACNEILSRKGVIPGDSVFSVDLEIKEKKIGDFLKERGKDYRIDDVTVGQFFEICRKYSKEVIERRTEMVNLESEKERISKEISDLQQKRQETIDPIDADMGRLNEKLVEVETKMKDLQT